MTRILTTAETCCVHTLTSQTPVDKGRTLGLHPTEEQRLSQVR